jgi:hypothetical protein
MTDMGSRQCCQCDEVYVYDRNDFEPPEGESDAGDGWTCIRCSDGRRNESPTGARKRGVRVDRLGPAKRAILAVMTRRL